MRDPCSILLTGASAGIGAALARAYAAPGRSLALGGRDALRLTAVAAECRARGATVTTAAIDVRDAAAMAGWIAGADAAAPLDLVIANAGVSAGTGSGEAASQARDIFAINLNGAANTVLPALNLMRARPRQADDRPRGQVALMASLAAFRGFAGAPAYCASKAALRAWGEALRALHRADAIEVSVVCPGFVRTAMSAVNDFPMPLLMEPDRAAAIVLRGLAENRGRIAFPWPLYWGVLLLAGLPDRLAGWITANAPRKTGPG
ncbi:MAG: SDR family NAD(P)-dependent oxidoreductase [Alphaproteobacteria bacterium]|nr:SDR family NAD(P)-dependent oxidoreductase [Alphaproteobacteria bacterium]